VIVSPSLALGDLPGFTLDPEFAHAVRSGAAIPATTVDAPDGSLVRLLDVDDLLGVYRVDGPRVRAEVVTA
jgi:hypothetical protein